MAAFLLMGVLGLGSIFSQDVTSPQLRGGSRGAGSNEVASLERRLGEIESDANLDEATKKLLGDKYREALGSLSEAADFRAESAEYQKALEKGDGGAKAVVSENESLKSELEKAAPLKVSSVSDQAEIRTALSEAELDLAKAKSDREKLDEQQVGFGTRPDQIRDRLPAAKRELAEAKEEVSNLEKKGASQDLTAGERADAARFAAIAKRLEAEIAKLEDEALSQGARQKVLDARMENAELRLTLTQRRVDALHALASSLSSSVIDRTEAELKQIFPDAEAVPESLKPYWDHLNGLVTKGRELADEIKEAEGRSRNWQDDIDEVESAYTEIREQVDLVGSEVGVGPALLEQWRSLPTDQWLKRKGAGVRKDLVKARGEQFELTRNLPKLPTISEGIPEETRAKFQPLEEARTQLIDTLRMDYDRLSESLAEQDGLIREYSLKCGRLRDLAVEKLFWLRSSPALGWSTIATLPQGIAYCFGEERWTEFREAITRLPMAYPIFCGVVLLILLGARRWFHRHLVETGRKTRRISSDKYTHTLKALFLTLLLAAPIPLALLFVAIPILYMGGGDTSGWMFTVGAELFVLTAFFAKGCLLYVLCRKDGLGEAHFHWGREITSRLRRLVAWILPVWAIGKLVLAAVEVEPSGTYLDSVGRVAGLFLVIGAGIPFAQMLHPEKGIAAAIHRKHSKSIFGKLRQVWYVLILAVVAFLSGLLLAGYVYTVSLLIDRLQLSLGAIVSAYAIYGLILRWFLIRQRKLALEDLRKQRQERVEAARKTAEALGNEGEEAADEGRIPEVKEEEAMELSEVALQIQRFIAFLVGAGLVARLYMDWTQFGPVLEVLDNFDTVGGFSIADLAVTALVVAVTTSTMRNLPGFLEVMVLRRLDLDAGTRNAMTTLAKYVVASVGAIVLFRNLGVDWSQFGWIAAALSVGLGFGLQEVVANFISGIILLFERPIRVGDIVTIDGIDGVVSRIQIRATTITNWDRKEFVVPNKQFVTGTLMNWTLSNKINRIVVVVGVAYGTDTERALQILSEVAGEHPLIMDDPAPLVSFEEFGDSALRLVLRCYLPDLDNRLTTISDLHTMIDRRYREAGIEIAFPQLDVHLRKEA